MSEMTDFLMEKTKPLRESLAIPLPENNDPQSLKELKKLASYAESQRANLAVMKRRVDVVVEERRNELSQQFDEEHKNDDKKPTKDVRDFYIRANMAEELSNQKFMDELQDVLRGRVSLCQSYLKSFNIEDRTSYMSNDLRIQ